MFFSINSIKTRLKLWFLAIALIPVLVVSSVIYQQRVNSIKQEAFIKLTAIRDLKISQINLWLEERVGGIQALAANDEVIRTTNFITGQYDTQSRTIDVIHQLFDHYIRLYNAWDEIFLIDVNSGKIIISSNKSSIGLDRSSTFYFKETLLKKGTYISNIYYSTSLHQPAMVFCHPVFENTREQTISGILVARVQLKRSLYGLLLDRSGMGRTGETLIVNDEAFALNDLRWFQQAPLKLKIKAKPAILASQGNTGITEAMDYRGENVLAAYGFIPKLQWGFVSKQDLVEIYAPIDVLIRNILIILAISAIFAYFVSNFIAGTISRPVIEMTYVSKKMREGNLTVRNNIITSDELGFLSESFNQMADSVRSQILVQQKVTAFTEALVVTADIADFSQILVTSLIELSGASLGAIHRKNDSLDQFEHLYSVGGDLSTQEPFNTSMFEGEFGKATALEKMVHLKNIPERTTFKIRSIMGTAIPNEMVTIPVIVSNQVKAIISLASLSPLSKERLEIIKLSQSSINTVFSNIIVSEKTRQLAQELETNNRELESQSNELKRQSDELLEQNRELERQQEQVAEANRLKSEFLSNMSHELRTPLNSIMALSRILVRRTKGVLSTEETEFLEIIERNGKQLLALINDILDLSKIEAGRVELEYQTFSIRSVIETILDNLSQIAAEKDVTLNHSFGEDLPPVVSDKSRVHQVLQNIIGNAIKFTEKGCVSVSVSENAQKMIIQVKDTGVGISQTALPHIFDEFRQADGSASRRYEGTGLGLAIANKAIKILGGNISAESVLDQGTTFMISLPINNRQLSVGETLENHPIDPHYSLQKNLDPHRKNILVVDDDPEILSYISGFFIKEGYNAIIADSGLKALKLVQQHRFSAITLDTVMPEMDGWEILQRLKANPQTTDIPVIIISIANDKKTGFALGATGYITKPITKHDLMTEINKIDTHKLRSILIVDDNEADLLEITHVIKNEGNINVTSATSGKKGLEIIEKTPPDLIILDLIMPKMNGFEVLKKLRSRPESSQIPVIISTAKDLTPSERKELQKGVTSIVTKQDTPNALFDELKKVMQRIESETDSLKITDKVSNPQILLVEDNESAIIQVTRILNGSGYHVEIARGGQEAINFVKNKIPDGVILDLMMPDINGFEVLEKIRSTEATAKIPILILTAKDLTKNDLKQLSANNIQQLVQKGDVDPEELITKIRLILGDKPTPEPRFYSVETQKGPYKSRGKKPGKLSILIVEDNPDNMVTLKAVLGDKYDTIEAYDGQAGLENVQSMLPDLVLLDISLPIMDGYQVVRKIRADKKTSHIPVIAITARAMKGEREDILRAGCDGYISKPIDADLLTEEIERWLK